MPKKKSLPAKPTPGQKKLASLGINLPSFPLTTTGSFPKTPDLSELKYRVSKGFQPRADLERKERMATEHWLRKQEKWGFDVLVDGEMNRGDLVSYFAGRIEGFGPGGLVRCYGNRYYRKPIIKGKLQWKNPLIADSWRTIQRTTNKPLKAVLTGPYTLVDWSFNEFYSHRDAAISDATAILKKEIASLVDGGAKIIQLDEPAFTSRPAEFSLFSDAIKEITQGVNAYFILHHSYGDLNPFWAKLQKLPVDQFSLETTNSQFSLLSFIKKHPTNKDLSLGVVESHRHNVETPKQISERIQKVLRLVPANQLWLSPDSGLKTRLTGEVDKKIDSLLKATQKLRASYK